MSTRYRRPVDHHNIHALQLLWESACDLNASMFACLRGYGNSSTRDQACLLHPLSMSTRQTPQPTHLLRLGRYISVPIMLCICLFKCHTCCEVSAMPVLAQIQRRTASTVPVSSSQQNHSALHVAGLVCTLYLTHVQNLSRPLYCLHYSCTGWHSALLSQILWRLPCSSFFYAFALSDGLSNMYCSSS